MLWYKLPARLQWNITFQQKWEKKRGLKSKSYFPIFLFLFLFFEYGPILVIVLLIFLYKFRTTAQESTTLPSMTQTEMILATAVTTVCSRLTLTKLILTTMERVMPVLLTLMVMVSHLSKLHLSVALKCIPIFLKANMSIFWFNRHSEWEWQLPICLQRGPERYWQGWCGRPLWQLSFGA